MLILVSGGAASGKSAHAERLLCERAAHRLYLATMQPFGARGQQRIARHRALRAGKGFETVERPRDLAGLTLPQHYEGILLEDLSNLLANELFASDPPQDAAAEILRGIDALRARCDTLVIVTNELFSDGLPYPAETVSYLRLLGQLNAALAARADRVYESVCGILLCQKGGETG